MTASFVGAHLLADNLLLQSWEICDLNLPAKLVARGLYYGKVVSSLWLAENQIVPVPVGVSPKKQSEVQYPGPRFLW